MIAVPMSSVAHLVQHASRRPDRPNLMTDGIGNRVQQTHEIVEMAIDGTNSHLADNPLESVTSVRDRNRERQRRHRDRQRILEPIIHETEDWQMFLDPGTLPQKAGCYASELPELVLKELVDNALDAGAKVSLRRDKEADVWVVSDDGPGIDPDRVPELFAVNRPLRSSKLKRLPLRGMLGNGLRVVMAWAGQLVVETRGAKLILEVDMTNGRTRVTNRQQVAVTPGVTVTLKALSAEDQGRLAKIIIELADQGFVYAGPSLPHWYGYADFARLLSSAPTEATAADVVRDLQLLPPKEFR